MNRADNQVLACHLPQIFGERAVGDPVQFPLQLVETARAQQQLMDDHHLPPPSHDGQG